MTQEFGLPCWKKENVSRAISSIARLDPAQVCYFLASHSPIQGLRDEKKPHATIDEENLFKDIAKTGQNDIFCLVYGEPGTGKSHLVHWLYLRFLYALESKELKNYIPVLVQRRSGTLKDALEQIIDQLGNDYAEYLNPVKRATENISSDTAKEDLVLKLSLELGENKRRDRKKTPLPRSLRYLYQACRDAGFGAWLQREGGVIDGNVKLLIEESSIEQREEAPQFSEEEFTKIKPQYRSRGDNSPVVLSLLDEVNDDKDLLQSAVDFLNESLKEALKEMIDLSGDKLNKIFENIRKGLKKKGKTLALFVEDVSVMAALNEEVVQAVEPRDNRELGRLIAILGLTPSGMLRLPKNQTDRATNKVSLEAMEGRQNDSWIGSGKKISEFVARYLNTIRLSEEEVKRVADARRLGGEINISRCENCSVKDECHSVFGMINIGGKELGMFPFTAGAPFNLLNHLIASLDRTPRNLLTSVLTPVLEAQYDLFYDREFPQSQLLAIQPVAIKYWTAFEQDFCGNWPSPQKNRLKFIAQMWAPEFRAADELAEYLKRFLVPFKFPVFSKEIVKKPLKPLIPPIDGSGRKVPEPPDDKLLDRLTILDEWSKGKNLTHDQYFRGLLSDFVRYSINWVDYRYPIEQWRSQIGDKSRYEFIRIEGQMSAVKHLVIHFPRTEEVKNLLISLVQHEAHKSWNFENGEKYKRAVHEYALNHGDEIVGGVSSMDGNDKNLPIATAAKFLCLAAMIKSGRELSGRNDKILNDILGALWNIEIDKKPQFLSEQLNKKVEDIEIKHGDIKQFVLDELFIPQGKTYDKVNFINPIPLLQCAESFVKEPGIKKLPDQYGESYWKSRYDKIMKLSDYGTLDDLFCEERDKIDNEYKKICKYIDSAGYKSVNLEEAMLSLFSDFENLINLCKKINIFDYDQTFQKLWDEGFFKKEKIIEMYVVMNGVRKKQKVNSGTEVLTLPGKKLRDISAIFNITIEKLNEIEREIKARSVEGDATGKENISKLRKSLNNLKDLKITKGK